jgi:hypothetical protein
MTRKNNYLLKNFSKTKKPELLHSGLPTKKNQIIYYLKVTIRLLKFLSHIFFLLL